MPSPALGMLQTFVMTSDRARAVPFYRDVLGLSLIGEDEFAVTFSPAPGAELRLTSLPGWQPHPHTVIGWDVDDIGAAVDALSAQGITCETYEGFGQDERGICRWGDCSLAWFKDPDGNVLSFTQRHPA